MKLIGAGFGRTGTMSLKAGLEQIGFGPCFHMIDLIRRPEHLELWEAAAAGRPVDWEDVFEGWESTVDWPGCTFWEQLVEVWPDAPVILTVRDPGAWYESCLRSIHAAAEAGRKGELKGGTDDPPPPEVMKIIFAVVWGGTFQNRFLDRDFAIETYMRHNEAVRAGVPDDRLLVWNAGDGWGPLCDFLGVDEPEEPFPHLNDRSSFREMVGLPV